MVRERVAWAKGHYPPSGSGEATPTPPSFQSANAVLLTGQAVVRGEHTGVQEFVRSSQASTAMSASMRGAQDSPPTLGASVHPVAASMPPIQFTAAAAPSSSGPTPESRESLSKYTDERISLLQTSLHGIAKYNEGIDIVASVKNRMIQQVIIASSQIGAVRDTLMEDNLLESRKRKNEFAYHAQHVAKFARTAKYHISKMDSQDVIRDRNGSWLLHQRNLESAGALTLSTVQQLVKDHPKDVCQRLLARALFERFKEAQSKSKVQLESAELKSCDYTKATRGDWRWEEPPSLDDLAAARWVRLGETGIPCLPSASCGDLERLLDSEALASCEASDLYSRTTDTVKSLKDDYANHITRQGWLLISVRSLPDLDEYERDSTKLYQGRCEHIMLRFDKAKRRQIFRATHRDRQAEKEVDGTSLAELPTGYEEQELLDPKRWMERVVENCPETALRYSIIDPTEGESWLNDILHPGAALSNCKEIRGINTPQRLISGAEHTTTALHMEDIHLGSLNLLVCGAPKVWLIVHPDDRVKLEEWIRRRLQIKMSSKARASNSCSQFVRHQSIILVPSQLDKEKIAYRVVVQRTGQMMYTEPGAYHQVVNMGKNVAIAINCTDDGLLSIPPDYRWCKHQCGDRNEQMLKESDFEM